MHAKIQGKAGRLHAEGYGEKALINCPTGRWLHSKEYVVKILTQERALIQKQYRYCRELYVDHSYFLSIFMFETKLAGNTVY